MKKRIWMLLASVLLVCALSTAFLPAAAETESVDRVYSALDMFDSFCQKGFPQADEYFFENGLWTVEYYDRSTQSFAPMAYYEGTLYQGMVGYINIFTVNEECTTQINDYTYCTISRLGRMHPAAKADAVLTFIAPADGVLSYNTAVNSYAATNTVEHMPNTYGTELALWLNDEKIWPQEENRKILTNDLGEVPLTVENLSVKKGDRIRLSIGSHNGEYKNKGVNLTALPYITYISASVPLNESVQGAPKSVWVTDKQGTRPTVTWLAVDNAVGYNIYVGETKVNDVPVNVERYTMSGVDASQSDITVTAVGPDGVESARSAPAVSIMTEFFREFDSTGNTYRIGRLLYNERGDVYASIPLPNTDSSSESAETSSSTDGGTVSDKTSDTVSGKETDSSVVTSSAPVTNVTDSSSDSSSDFDSFVTDDESNASETLPARSDGVGVTDS